jgi:type IV pilus assembly protein PilC
MYIFSHTSIQERVDFANNLSVMLKSGISINEALGSLGDQSDSGYFKETMYRLKSDIENGTLLSDAFKKEAPTFGPIFVSMIKAGEQSGTLQNNLLFLADLLSRSADLKREVNAATLYPKMVFGAAVILGGGLAVFILPRLTPLFEGLNVELPLMTRVLLSVSLFVQEYWLFTLLSIIGLCIAIIYSNRILSIRRFYHLLYIKLPFLGTLLRNYQLAFISQLFSTLLKSGLTLNDTVEIVARAVTNIRYQEALEEVKEGAEKGESLSATMRKFEGLFPKLVISIIAVGEKSGTLGNSFGYLSELYTKDVSARARKLPTIIEPLLLVFIAMMVGFVALSIIMPIYELTGNISR